MTEPTGTILRLPRCVRCSSCLMKKIVRDGKEVRICLRCYTVQPDQTDQPTNQPEKQEGDGT